MSAIATIKIKTGPDTYVTVNESDYEDFKFMEYVEPIVETVKEVIAEPVQEIIQEPVQEVIPEITTRRKRASQEEA